MKKMEQQKTSFPDYQVSNGSAQPVAPVTGRQQASNTRNADPSSTFRSNRYPVPSFGHRVGATQ